MNDQITASVNSDTLQQLKAAGLLKEEKCYIKTLRKFDIDKDDLIIDGIKFTANEYIFTWSDEGEGELTSKGWMAACIQEDAAEKKGLRLPEKNNENCVYINV